MLCWNYGLASTYIHELAESGGQTRGSAPTKKAYNCLSGQLYHRGAKDFSPLQFNKSTFFPSPLSHRIRLELDGRLANDLCKHLAQEDCNRYSARGTTFIEMPSMLIKSLSLRAIT